MTINEYARLNLAQKKEKIKNEGIFIEYYESDDQGIYVYFLNEFFIEVILKDANLTDILPYKRGYKFNKSEAHEAQ